MGIYGLELFQNFFQKFPVVVISRRFYFLNHIELNKNMCAHKINFPHEITLLSGKLFQIYMCLLDLVEKVHVNLRPCNPLPVYFKHMVF